MDKPTTKEVARFFDKVQITKQCWLWTAQLNGSGYGHFWFHGKHVGAHRFSYELFVSSIESGKMILHRRECGNRICVNPNHLYMGTHDDNMRDRMMWGDHHFGEKHKSSRISVGDVLAIRQMRKDGNTCKSVANIYDIHLSQVSRISRGVQWKHIAL